MGAVPRDSIGAVTGAVESQPFARLEASGSLLENESLLLGVVARLMVYGSHGDCQRQVSLAERKRIAFSVD